MALHTSIFEALVSASACGTFKSRDLSYSHSGLITILVTSVSVAIHDFVLTFHLIRLLYDISRNTSLQNYHPILTVARPRESLSSAFKRLLRQGVYRLPGRAQAIFYILCALLK